MSCTGRIRRVADLPPAERGELFDTFARHYARVRRDAFERDLAEKRWLLEVLEGGRRVGFSTATLVEAGSGAERVRALFSGDTIVEPSHWSETALFRAWSSLALALAEDAGPAGLPWFLISQGFRTYRLLPLFFREYWPRPEVGTPAAVARGIELLGVERGGGRYADGVIRAGPESYRLEGALATIPAAHAADPYVRFFLERNPGWTRGDELCCWCPVSAANLTRAGQRVAGDPADARELVRGVPA